MSQKTKKKRTNLEKIGRFVFYSMLIPIGFLILKIIQIDAGYTDPLTHRSRGDYLLMIIQCILGMIALWIPGLIQERKKLEVPNKMYFLYLIFLYCAICLGEIRGFYYRVPNWDTILHTFSGGMLGALGFSFISLLNNEENFHLKLTPFFVSLFSFMFAIMLGVLWEVYEFAFDGLLGLNMQKFMLESGEQLIGRAALADTMEDLIVDMAGAFVMSVIGYISLKYKKGWVESMIIKVKKTVVKDVKKDADK
jgi:hypothetical protein